jgi:glycine dehydrogenase subunit 1
VAVPGVRAWSTEPFFREFAIRVPGDARDVVAAMAEHEVLAGVAASSLDTTMDSDVLIVTVTERRTKDDIDHYVATLRKVLGS